MSLKVLDHDESRFNGDNSPRDEERPRINEFSLNHRSFARSNHLLDQTIATSLGRYQVSVFFFFLDTGVLGDGRETPGGMLGCLGFVEIGNLAPGFTLGHLN